MNDFERIGGNEYDFLPQELTSKIRQAGTRKVVFVEGETDERIFSILFRQECAGVANFIAVNGCLNVKKYVSDMIEKKDFFGIIDRDFKSDEERNQEIQEHHNRLYIHQRYTIENYLIETMVLRELLMDQKLYHNISDAELEEIIHTILKNLISIMAGNWILLKFSESFLNQDMKLGEGSPDDKNIVWLNVLKKLKESGCNFDENEIKSEYENFIKKIKQNSGDINELHKYINGKYFFIKFAIKNRFSLRHKEIRYHLARILKEEGLQQELKDILKFINVH